MITKKQIFGLATVMENSRPDCFEPRKIEREIQWNHTLEQLCWHIMHNNAFEGFDRDAFVEQCGGKFEHK